MKTVAFARPESAAEQMKTGASVRIKSVGETNETNRL